MQATPWHLQGHLSPSMSAGSIITAPRQMFRQSGFSQRFTRLWAMRITKVTLPADPKYQHETERRVEKDTELREQTEEEESETVNTFIPCSLWSKHCQQGVR